MKLYTGNRPQNQKVWKTNPRIETLAGREKRKTSGRLVVASRQVVQSNMASRKGGRGYYDEDEYYDYDDDYYDDYDEDYYDESEGGGQYDQYDDFADGGRGKKNQGQGAAKPKNNKSSNSQKNTPKDTKAAQSSMAKGICAQSDSKNLKQDGSGLEAASVYPLVPEKQSVGVKSFQFDTPHPDQKKTSFQRPSDTTTTAAAAANPNSAAAAAGSSEGRSGMAVEGSQSSKQGCPGAVESLQEEAAREADSKALSECLKELKLMESQGSKPNILLVVLGHVDAGKSTLTGRLLADLGLFGEKEVRKRAHQASQMGKGSFGWAWLMDERPEERERGVTIDIAKRIFETDKRQVTILDAPGHRDFVPNAISGMIQADAAILVIDGSVGGFESGFEKRGKISGQTKEHAQLAKGIGIEQLAVIVTKLDKSENSKDRFNEIKGKLEPFLKSCGYQNKNVQWLLASGTTGENITSRPQPDSSVSWFTGPTVVEAIDSFTIVEHSREKPLRVPVFAVSNTKQGGGGNVVVTGRLTTGFLKVNSEVMLMYGEIRTQVKSIVRNNQNAKFALAGDAVELTLTQEDTSLFETGSVLCSLHNRIKPTERIRVKIITLELALPFTLGQNLILHCHSATAPVKVTKMLSLHDPRTGEEIKKKPRILKSFQTATVELSLLKKTCVERYEDYPSLGRIVLRLGGQTVGVGKVTKIY